MSDLMQFAEHHPWMTFFMFWIACFTIVSPFKMACLAWNRYLRSKNIAARGWPTAPNMDADGDIIHKDKP